MDGSLIRKAADSKISGCAWAGPLFALLGAMGTFKTLPLQVYGNETWTILYQVHAEHFLCYLSYGVVRFYDVMINNNNDHIVVIM